MYEIFKSMTMNVLVSIPLLFAINIATFIWFFFVKKNNEIILLFSAIWVMVTVVGFSLQPIHFFTVSRDPTIPMLEGIVFKDSHHELLVFKEGTKWFLAFLPVWVVAATACLALKNRDEN